MGDTGEPGGNAEPEARGNARVGVGGVRRSLRGLCGQAAASDPEMTSIQTPVQLYRYLLRVVRKLPKNMQGHYQHHVRQSYNSHVDEIDAERIQEIINRAVQDAEWLLKKYEKKD